MLYHFSVTVSLDDEGQTDIKHLSIWTPSYHLFLGLSLATFLLWFGSCFSVLFAYFRRIFTNIFSHAEQISQVCALTHRSKREKIILVLHVSPMLWLLQAMIVRGFRGDSNAHKIYLLSDPSIGTADIVSLLCLVGVIGASVWFGYFLVWSALRSETFHR